MRILKTQRSIGGRRIKKLENVSSRTRTLRNSSGISGEKFSEKLQALKSLLPTSTRTKLERRDKDVEEESGRGDTEQLFQETADYIVQLRSQVLVLQKLIKIYGSPDQTEDYVL